MADSDRKEPSIYLVDFGQWPESLVDFGQWPEPRHRTLLEGIGEFLVRLGERLGART